MSGQFAEDFVKAYATVMEQLPLDTLEEMAGTICEAWKNEKTVYLIGNGGSASTATHLACDLSKCTIVEGCKRLKVLSLVDNIPLVSAWTNDDGFATIFEEQLKSWLAAGDVLIAFSVHGGSGESKAGPWSQNLPRAIDYASAHGAKILGFSGFGGGYLARAADHCLTVPIDREPLGTPVVESMHSMLAHLLAQLVRLGIERERG